MTAGASTRPRYNSQIMAKFIDTSQPNTKPLAPNISQNPLVRYNQYWDADLQTYMYLEKFLNVVPGWLADLTTTALANGTPSQHMDPEQLDRELRQIVDLAPEREERFFEIMDQDDADGAYNYWFGMLQVSPSRHPGIYLMVRAGRRIGEHVVICLKGFFRSPRPSQLCPGIVPMIDPPSTRAFRQVMRCKPISSRTCWLTVCRSCRSNTPRKTISKAPPECCSIWRNGSL
jgi:hypothetical protein